MIIQYLIPIVHGLVHEGRKHLIQEKQQKRTHPGQTKPTPVRQHKNKTGKTP